MLKTGKQGSHQGNGVLIPMWPATSCAILELPFNNLFHQPQNRDLNTPTLPNHSRVHTVWSGWVLDVGGQIARAELWWYHLGPIIKFLWASTCSSAKWANSGSSMSWERTSKWGNTGKTPSRISSHCNCSTNVSCCYYLSPTLLGECENN